MKQSLLLFVFAVLLLLLAESAYADDTDQTPAPEEDWSIHAQSTGIVQGYSNFHSPYQGPDSLSGAGQSRETVSATGFLGGRLPWQGGELYLDPEAIQGLGVGNTAGIAGFPNGEAQKAGRVIPEAYVARLFVRQTFGLGGAQETITPDQNQLGESVAISRVTVTAGKMQVTDLFDNNAYSHDSRTQFMNIALVDGGAYDYAANQKGYTYGEVTELNQKNWALRAGYFLVPKVADSNDVDWQVGTRGAANIELENRYNLFDQPGTLRLLGFANRANAGSFTDALTDPGGASAGIVDTRTDRTKYGFVLNLEQAVNDDLGLFSRTSWNDGQEENISYADIDASYSLGASLKGTTWDRPNDGVGIGGAINRLSNAEQKYLAAGGTGLIIGDGQLAHDATEDILEAYYSYQIVEALSFSFDYQFVANPAYNADRGPVNLFAGRLHAAF
jgi:high affinity Mn2+ porin